MVTGFIFNKMRHFSKSWLCLIVIISFVVFVRIRLLEIPLERDEGEYAYMGQLILQGVPPYSEAYNMKFPGTYIMYAFIMWLFGQTIGGVHIGLLIVNCITILLVFFLGKIIVNERAALIAGCTYALLSLSSSVFGFAAHATHFVVLPALGGTLLMLHALEKQKLSLYFLSGALFGMSFITKQPGIFFLLFGATYILYHHFSIKKEDGNETPLLSFPPACPIGRLVGNPSDPLEALKKDSGYPNIGHRQANSRPAKSRCSSNGAAGSLKALLLKLGPFSLGALLPLLGTLLWLYAAGVFPRFWFWTVGYASRYGSRVPFSDAFSAFESQFSHVAESFFILWVIGGLGFLVMLSRRDFKNKVFMSSYTFFSFLTVCPGFYFRPHYFITFLPALAILVGILFDYLDKKVTALLKFRYVKNAAFGIFLSVILFGIFDQKEYFFKEDPWKLSRIFYKDNPFPESIEIARFIEARTYSTDRVAVFGSEPQIFFYANRRSATGYIYMYNLTEKYDFSLMMQKEMTKEIESFKPKFIVEVHVITSWLRRQESENYLFDWIENYVRESYALVGVIDIISRDMTVYKWFDEANRYKVMSPSYVLIFERR